MFHSRTVPVAIWLLAILASIAALDLASSMLEPVVFALVVGVVLSPFARRIDRLGAPSALSAFVTLAMSLAVLVFLAVLAEPVVSDAIDRAPYIRAEVRGLLTSLQDVSRGVDEMSEEVASALNDETAKPETKPVEVPKLRDALIYAPGFLGQLMVFVGTLYFFLLARRDVYAWIGASSLSLDADAMIEAERRVSRYFLTITVINGVFALLVTAVLLALGMPYAALWGFAAFLSNFVLYLGPAVFAAALVLGGMVSFSGPISFVPVTAYVLLNMMEGQFVTPALVGRQMAVNPLLVFLSLVFWLWLWGPIGGIIAIPLLVWAIAIHERITKGQTISSGTPGRLRPNRLAGPTE